MKVYQLNTVTFGISASPFLALRTIQQLATDEAQNFPSASATVLRDMYVDDLVSSVEDVTQARQLFQDLIWLFNSGGFQLVKWSTNSKDLLKNIPSDLQCFQCECQNSRTAMAAIY